jgi:hypothetical protein
VVVVWPAVVVVDAYSHSGIRCKQHKMRSPDYTTTNEDGVNANIALFRKPLTHARPVYLQLTENLSASNCEISNTKRIEEIEDSPSNWQKRTLHTLK